MKRSSFALADTGAPFKLRHNLVRNNPSRWEYYVAAALIVGAVIGAFL